MEQTSGGGVENLLKVEGDLGVDGLPQHNDVAHGAESVGGWSDLDRNPATVKFGLPWGPRCDRGPKDLVLSRGRRRARSTSLTREKPGYRRISGQVTPDSHHDHM